MSTFYQHIHTALRSALVDRDRDAVQVVESARIIDFGSMQYAVKNEIPSGAALIAYSMLFYPNWLKDSTFEYPKPLAAREFSGGEDNKSFNLLVNPGMLMIALAVGAYAGFFVPMNSQLGVFSVYPNHSNPLVNKTQKLIQEHQLRPEHARQVFIELMQDEEYRGTINLADDYIANTSWIEVYTAERGEF